MVKNTLFKILTKQVVCPFHKQEKIQRDQVTCHSPRFQFQCLFHSLHTASKPYGQPKLKEEAYILLKLHRKSGLTIPWFKQWPKY